MFFFPSSRLEIAALVNLGFLAIAWISPKKLLTPMGYLHAWVLGVLVWVTLQWQGYLVVVFYFLVGSAVTKIGMAQKEAEGIAEKRSGMRGPENVWGSALVATICAIATIFVDSPLKELLILGYVASFATKLSDTTASEVGKAYGQRTFLITTLKPVPRGTEGAISLEGTLAGIVGSIVIAVVGWAVGLINLYSIIICLIAAFIATNIESVIGASIQSRFLWLTNEIVNILNTAIGAIVAIAIGLAIDL
ncbi:MAG: TIGR00297 family protein [Xenococcaceae cyanobacterium MO_207.B15]|nr:TIGR00297 family protein [Xenococcaceae cyanobacterium MO_207.B15]MDJ0743016.1 TIGR00297 family protein [Xenococcaceae cyanobacterium MO_167.B27]